MNWHAPHKKRKKKRKVTIPLNSKNVIKKLLLKCKKINLYQNREANGETLYIIGNGFDIHHGLKTNYSDFKNYIQENYDGLLQVIRQYYDIENYSLLWSEFEKGLKGFDPIELEDNFGNYLPDYASDNFRDRDRYDLERYVERELEPLKIDLQEAFNNWVNDMKIPLNINDRKIKLDKNAKFLNFNYTTILETNYNVSRENITYIHNRIGEDKNLLYGHSWEPGEWAARRLDIMPNDLNEEDKKRWREEQSEKYDYSIERGYVAVDDFFTSIFKDCKTNMDNNKSFFSNLKNTTKIYILGHAISEVDLPYFKEIIKRVDCRKTDWIINDFRGDFKNKKRTLVDLGISSNKITSIRLSDIEKYKQLDLF